MRFLRGRLRQMESKKRESDGTTSLMKPLNKSEGNLKSKEKEISSFDENRIMRSAVPRLFKVNKYWSMNTLILKRLLASLWSDALGVIAVRCNHQGLTKSTF